jgi:purine-binding chemotaxis protein CheW
MAMTSGTRTNTSRRIYGTFYLSGDEFAIEMEDLQEVVNAPAKLQRMPLAPSYLLGLFNLRGRILPVIDLCILLHAEKVETTAESTPRMAVLRRGAACLGLLFDAVGEILRILPEDLAPIEQRNVSAEVPKMPVKAVICRDGGERVIQVLDLGALLSIRNLPLIEKLTGGEEANQHLTSRMKDLYREKLIGFTVGDCNIAIEMKCVIAIVENNEKKPSPCRSELCSSVITFHGRLVPVVPMAQLLRISTAHSPKHIMVCRLGNDHVGFEVDEISSIIPYATDKVIPIPVLDNYRSSIFHGCFTDRDGKDFIVLNEEGTLSKAEILEISVKHKKFNQQDETIEAAKAAAPQVSLLTFRIGKLYGLKLLDVLEVLVSPKELTRAPDTPPAVLGVLNLRGTPVSVVDPRRLFDLGSSSECAGSNILVFQHEDRKVAMCVDSVESILSVPAGSEAELPAIFFREDQPKLQETFERGIHVMSNGNKTVVLVLSADQIVKRLSDAMVA